MSKEGAAGRWQQLKTVFAEACTLDTTEREAWLESACAGDDALRDEVRSLLAAHDAVGPLDRLEDDVMVPLQRRAAASSPEGRQIGPYQVLSELGRGGMGHVYRARDTRLDRSVALKFLPAHRSMDSAIKARFMREARAASALDHPNICTIYDVGEADDGQLYLAMACYDGETLAQKIERGRLPLDEALDIARQVAEGLASAHEAGITHRDVKPSNLMLTERGLVKILDFGIAKLDGQGPHTSPGTRIGTMAYMAPEQVRGDSVDPRADLWALGVVLYEMIAGRRPFQTSSETALHHAILHEEPPPVTTFRPAVPAALERLLGRLLAKAPEERYRRADELADALRDLQSGRADPVLLHPRALPVSLTSFVGREQEIERVEHLLSSARVVTLTGPAGTGKTRLALQIAVRLEKAYPDGVGFVSLASVTDPGLVASAIAQALGVTTAAASSPLDLLKHRLRDRDLLLLLDNFEQVVAAAPIVAELLAECPALDILVTSRVALRVSGEHAFPVPPLALSEKSGVTPKSERAAASVQLFVERARAVRPDFALTEENAPVVAELCRRLDGLPLAIELAAARIKLFSPRAMLKRLEQRFDLLKGGPRDVPARHQTLREAIAWSYHLLNEAHRQLFRRMAVCVGGCSLEAVRALALEGETQSNVVDGLAALVDHSFVSQEETPDGEPRFTMLETLRAYGVERLKEAGELAEVRRRHAAHYLERAERAEKELTGASQAGWFDRLEQEHGNLRAALRWAEAQRASEVGLRLGAALWRFWIARGYLLEGRQWLERLLDLPMEEALVPVRARVLDGLGTVAHNQGDNAEARALLEESLGHWRTLGDERGTAGALNNLAWVACETSDFDGADALAREAEALCRRIDDRRGVALALNNLGWVANYRGEYRSARTFHRESLDLRRKLGDQRGIAFALANLAWAEANHGDYERTTALLDEAFALAQEVKDGQLCTWIDVIRGYAARDRGDTGRATPLLEKSLARWTEGSNKSIRAWALSILGGVYVDQDDPEHAAPHLHESLDVWQAIGCTWGEAMVACEFGRLAAAQGDLEGAFDQYATSWQLRCAMKDRRGMVECMEGLVECAIQRGERRRAVHLLAAADVLRRQIEVPLPACRKSEREAQLALLRKALGEHSFTRACEEGATMSPEEVVRRVVA